MRLDARESSVPEVALRLRVMVLAEVCVVVVGADPFGGLLDFAETTVDKRSSTLGYCGCQG
jgi:hypothetical protein